MFSAASPKYAAVLQLASELELAAPLGLRLGGDERDCPQGGILPKQRALRSLDELHTLHIEQRDPSEPLVAEKHAIEERGDGAVEAEITGLGADAAERDARNIVGRLRIHEAGNQVGHFRELRDLIVLHLLGRQHVYRQRHVLDRLLPLRCGNHDLLDLSGHREARPQRNQEQEYTPTRQRTGGTNWKSAIHQRAPCTRSIHVANPLRMDEHCTGITGDSAPAEAISSTKAELRGAAVRVPKNRN